MLLLLLLMCEIVVVDLAQRARGTGAGAIPGTCTGHGCRRGQSRDESAGHGDKPRGHGRVGGPTPHGVFLLNPRQSRTPFAFGMGLWQQRGGCSRAGTGTGGCRWLALALPR